MHRFFTAIVKQKTKVIFWRCNILMIKKFKVCSAIVNQKIEVVFLRCNNPMIKKSWVQNLEPFFENLQRYINYMK